MKTIRKKIKNSNTLILKPVSKDIYYEYVCTKCGCNHWVTHREATNKSFCIVCDCGIIIKPKRILDTKIIYKKKQKPVVIPAETSTIDKAEQQTTVDIESNPQDETELELELADEVEDSVISSSQEVSVPLEIISDEEKIHEQKIKEIQDQAVGILSQYGYTTDECLGIIWSCEEKLDIKKLVKEALIKIGKKHEYFYNQTYEI
jgi:hypothetical protein